LQLWFMLGFLQGARTTVVVERAQPPTVRHIQPESASTPRSEV
jgi:hypothetical protein